MSVTIKNLSKAFTTARGLVGAVRELNLQVGRGEFFSLLGPSGCGKTTTIRCLAGLETPDDGEIWLGEDLVFSRVKKRMLPVHQRKIGMVFQSYAIWPHMNVFDNVAFPLKYGMGRRPSQREIQERVERACALVQLEGFESRPATQLSGGQQQRVALARSLVREPEVVLLDEPLSNLDAKLRAEMRLELRQLLKKAGATAVYVTHDQAEAFAVSDRIGVMMEGRLIQVGAPREIYLHPQESFIAEFVGRINFLEGEVTRAEGKKVVRTPIGQVEFWGIEERSEGEKVRLGIRAESIQLAEAGRGEGVNCFTGVVQSAVFLGEHIDCEVEIGDQVFSVMVPPELEVGVGSRVRVLFPPRAWMVLPQAGNKAQSFESGNSIA
jgi:iron(III) transport system ATP-binding protein